MTAPALTPAQRELSETIRAMRKKQKITVKRLAYLSGYSISYIELILCGRRNPPPKTVERIMAVLDGRKPAP